MYMIEKYMFKYIYIYKRDVRAMFKRTSNEIYTYPFIYCSEKYMTVLNDSLLWSWYISLWVELIEIRHIGIISIA